MSDEVRDGAELAAERLAGRLEAEARTAERNARVYVHEPVAAAYEDGKAKAYHHGAALAREGGASGTAEVIAAALIVAYLSSTASEQEQWDANKRLRRALAEVGA